MILQGDCLEAMKTLDSESIQCCITSPPYFGLRDYEVDGQIGIELNPEYIKIAENRIAKEKQQMKLEI